MPARQDVEINTRMMGERLTLGMVALWQQIQRRSMWSQTGKPALARVNRVTDSGSNTL